MGCSTTRHECARILRASQRTCDAGYAIAAGTIPDDHARAAEQDLVAERHAAFREAFGELPQGCQQLLAFLTHDPALSYAEISATLRHPATIALINPGI